MRRRDIKRVSGAHQSVVRRELPLEWLHHWVVALNDPSAAVDDALSLKATELQRDVLLELHDAVGTRSDACEVFVELPHHTVPRPWICSVGYAVLKISLAGGIQALSCEEFRSDLVVLREIFRLKNGKQLIKLDQRAANIL